MNPLVTSCDIYLTQMSKSYYSRPGSSHEEFSPDLDQILEVVRNLTPFGALVCARLEFGSKRWYLFPSKFISNISIG